MLCRSGSWLLLGVVALTAGCSLFTHGSGPQSTPSSSSRAARLYTDSDTVTGVGATPNGVFIATSSRGVLRYPSDGNGTPSRMTTRDGLPDDHIYALSVGTDHVIWVATAQGVARLATDRWGTVGFAQPDVGRATAIISLDNGDVLVGGSQGIARYDGSRWLMLTDHYQVMGFIRDEGRVLVATAQNGVVALADDFSSLDEFGTASGIPDALVRSVVPVGQRRMWALVQGPGGARLGYYDGHRWVGYTHGTQRGHWISLVPSRRAGSASLLIDGQVFDIVPNGGDALTALEAGTADQRTHEDIHATPIEAPAAAPTTPRGRTAAPATPAPVAHSGPRPRNIPPFSAPVDMPDPHSVPSDVPRFGLAPAQGMSAPNDTIGLYAQGNEVYAARAGVGVSRIVGGNADFRTRDLGVHHRPLSLATDGNGAVWVVTDDNGVVRFDGEHFSRQRLDEDDSIVPLMFWSRGPVAAAVARVRPNVLGAYRFSDNGWQQVSTRRIDLGGPGLLDVRFLAVDDRGRFWVGIRSDANGTMHEHGVAMIDGNLPQPVQFHSHVGQGRRRARNTGGVRAPDDLAAIDFDNAGHPWFAGVSGATMITPADGRAVALVQTFGEAQGVRGDVVADIARGPNGNIYAATPDGIGRYNGERWDFALPGAGDDMRAVALATDTDGILWGAGPRGVWRYDGRALTRLSGREGLPAHPVEDIAVDGENRVWLSSEDGLTILARGTEPTASDTSTDTTSSGGDDNSSL